MIDLHSHILPGIDDGPRTLEESLEIARAAVSVGVVTIAATPHVRLDYPTSADTIESAVASLRQALEAREIPLQLLSGAEIALDYLPRLDEHELARLGLGGNPRALLLEFPYAGWPAGLAAELAGLRARGVTVVLAHPERNPEVQAAPASLAPLVEAGTLVQLTAASLAGTFGGSARTAALDLLGLELAHLVAGDVHSSGSRVEMGPALVNALGSDEGLAGWLTSDVPAAVLRSEPVPERPPRRRRRAWSVLRFRR